MDDALADMLSGTELNKDVHVYGLRHPSARCGFNAENYKPYLKNLI